MSCTTLPPAFSDVLLQHLQAEAVLLQRLQSVSDDLIATAHKVPDLTSNQSVLSELLNELLQMQLRRQGLRQAISRLWNCDPVSVRLGRIQLDTPAAMTELQRLQSSLKELAVSANASLRAAEETLRGWSGIVTYILGELLDATGTSDRYTAKGQRVAPIRGGGLDVRS